MINRDRLRRTRAGLQTRFWLWTTARIVLWCGFCGAAILSYLRIEGLFVFLAILIAAVAAESFGRLERRHQIEQLAAASQKAFPVMYRRLRKELDRLLERIGIRSTILLIIEKNPREASASFGTVLGLPPYSLSYPVRDLRQETASAVRWTLAHELGHCSSRSAVKVWLHYLTRILGVSLSGFGFVLLGRFLFSDHEAASIVVEHWCRIAGLYFLMRQFDLVLSCSANRVDEHLADLVAAEATDDIEKTLRTLRYLDRFAQERFEREFYKYDEFRPRNPLLAVFQRILRGVGRLVFEITATHPYWIDRVRLVEKLGSP